MPFVLASGDAFPAGIGATELSGGWKKGVAVAATLLGSISTWNVTQSRRTTDIFLVLALLLPCMLQWSHKKQRLASARTAAIDQHTQGPQHDQEIDTRSL